MIYETTGYNFENTDEIICRFIKCFLKAFAKDDSNKLRVEGDKRMTK